MPKIEGLEKVVAALRARTAKMLGKEAKVSVLVGYTQNYAVYVHENLQARHPVGQAKYLEQPARQHAQEFGAICHKAIAKGMTLAQGLVLAGLQLQRYSQQLVPVDTSALKNSAFTRLEKL